MTPIPGRSLNFRGARARPHAKPPRFEFDLTENGVLTRTSLRSDHAHTLLSTENPNCRNRQPTSRLLTKFPRGVVVTEAVRLLSGRRPTVAKEPKGRG